MRLFKKETGKDFLFVSYVHECLPTRKSVHQCVHHSWRLEEGTGHPGTRVTDGYKLAVGAGNQAWVL